MTTIRCPRCGSPVTVRGSRWECGWCGDFGDFSSLRPAEKAKVLQAVEDACKVKLTFSVKENPPLEEGRKNHPFDKASLEDMVRRWDFSENRWACRDLLAAAFPEAVGRWTEKEWEEMDTMDLLVETSQRDPQTAIQMIELLLNTAEEHLQDKEAANQLLGWDMLDTLSCDTVLPLLVEELKENSRLARQLFQSAYVGQPQEVILHACGWLGETALQKKLVELLQNNPFPHDPLEWEKEEK